MSISGLGYIGISASDTTAWKALLRDVLGLMEGVPDGDAVRMRMDAQAWRIAVEPGDEDDLAYVGFEVASPADLEIMRGRLRQAGIETTDGDPEWG